MDISGRLLSVSVNMSYAGAAAATSHCHDHNASILDVMVFEKQTRGSASGLFGIPIEGV